MKHTRTISLVLALAGIALLLCGLLVPIFWLTDTPQPSVGIIGGADGPTYLLTLKAVADGLFLWIAIAGAILLVAALVLLIFGKSKKK